MIGWLAKTSYKLAIRCYPRAFRELYGTQMLHDFVTRGRRLVGLGRRRDAWSGWLRALVTDSAAGLRMRTRNFSGHGIKPRSPRGLKLGGKGFMGDVLRDLQYSARMLTKNPLFTIAAVVTLALGIGLNAATFSTVNGLLLRPLGGVSEPDELVLVYRRWAGIEFGSNSIPHYQSLRDLTRDEFDGIATWTFTPLSLSADGSSERTIGMMVSANFFQTFGVVPQLGRPFLPGVEDVGPGAHPVAVLGHGYWQSRFGGDPEVVGNTILLNGHNFEIVGVAPEAFKGPVNFADVPIYVPVMMQREVMPGRDFLESRGNNSMDVVVRLRDGQSLEQAQAVFDATVLQLLEEFPNSYDDQLGTTLVRQTESGIHPSFRNAQVGMSAVMMAVVSLLLLIACVNVANLFLARARERRREMGIRLSLGAGTRRIIQQLLTESVVFSLIAGIVGLGIAQVALTLLSGFRPPFDGPFRFAVQMDNRVLLFTLAISGGAGLLFGLAPALQTANPNTMAAVKGESSDKAKRSKIGSTLVVVQMALSLLLLISSGLFLRSLKGATQIDPGFDEPAHLVMASLDPGLQGYDQVRSQEFFDRLLGTLEAMPEVTSVGLTNSIPLGFGSSDRSVGIPGYEFTEGERNSLYYAIVSDGYLEAMQIGLLEGRTFTEQDDETAAPVIVINQRFGERFWPGESAVGKVVRTAGEDRQVIGVVETGKYNSLGEDPSEFMYLPYRELFRTDMTLIARSTVAPENVLRAIRQTVVSMDPDMPLYDVRTMEDHMGIALLPARLGGSVLGIFGVLGLVLAAVGIYGVMSYSVVQRTRELGIRIALGATTSTVVRQVLGEGMKLTVLGAVIGLFGAVGAAQLVKGLLYNVGALDPVSFLAVPALLIAVAALAVYLPARRAASVEPVKALKSE